MGGAPEIPQRSFGEEWPQIKQGFKGQEKQYLQFAQHTDPLLGSAYSSAMKWLDPVLQSGGKLTPEQIRDVTQSTLGPYAQRQNAIGPQAYAAQLLGRDVYRRQRFAEALGQTLGIEKQGVESYTALTNPILGYLSDLFSSNQSAAGQSAIAGANKSGGLTGAGIGAAGAIGSGALIAL